MLIYNLLIYLYGWLIKIASLRKIKAKQWVLGRKNWYNKLASKISKLPSDKRIWVHCASYGEFEQGRPLIEAIKKKHPDFKIILSFFSPSGYEPFKNWAGAEVICYLPLDTPGNAEKFIALIKPQIAIFIKYEFWVNFLFQLKKQNIPTYLVSATFKPHHPFFKWYGGIFVRSLKTFNELFLQDQNSAKLLEAIGIKNYEVCGDTRFDRVLHIKENFQPIPFFEEFCLGKQVLIAGSTWQKDEELLIETFCNLTKPDLKLILVPHQVDEKSISNLEQLLQKYNLQYSLFSTQKVDVTKNILIVDAMGLLSKIYHYASVAYIGGGFNSGIHNCIEPAVYFKPVLFYGDDYHKYNEAIDLLNLKTAKNISNTHELKTALLNFLDNKTELVEIETKLKKFFEQNSGSTKKVIDFINWD